MYARHLSDSISFDGTPDFGKHSTVQFYREIKDYYYPGDGKDFSKGSTQTEITGHTTQVRTNSTSKQAGF